MKLLVIVLLILSATANSAYSQLFCKDICAYAFQQYALPGMIADLENSTENSGADTSYLIYLEYPADLKPSMQEIWIRGTGFFITKMQLEQTPVILNRSLPGSIIRSDTLVQKSAKKVYRLYQGKRIGRSVTARFRSIIQSNDLVIFYKLGSTHYFLPVRKLVILEPIAFQ